MNHPHARIHMATYVMPDPHPLTSRATRRLCIGIAGLAVVAAFIIGSILS